MNGKINLAKLFMDEQEVREASVLEKEWEYNGRQFRLMQAIKAAVIALNWAPIRNQHPVSLKQSEVSNQKLGALVKSESGRCLLVGGQWETIQAMQAIKAAVIALNQKPIRNQLPVPVTNQKLATKSKEHGWKVKVPGVHEKGDNGRKFRLM